MPGGAKLLVDILVSGSETGKSVFVPEIRAYAQQIPHLDFLVEEKLRAIVMSKNYVIPVNVPTPLRFAVHKLFSSQSRINQPSKAEKDIRQAATIIAAVEEKLPGDTADMMLNFPIAGLKKMLLGATAALPLIASQDQQTGEEIEHAIARCKSKMDLTLCNK